MKMKRAGLLAGSALLALAPMGTSMTAFTTGATFVAALTAGMVRPALADGGKGGNGENITGGSGGAAGSPNGGNASAPTGTSNNGGGGGGGAAGGGAGGNGVTNTGVTAGLGATTPGGDGDSANQFIPGGGGGGGGGLHGFDGSTVLDNTSALTGGNGGNGGLGGQSNSGSGGGGGGEGGYGGLVSNTGESTNSSQIRGGTGGTGGNSGGGFIGAGGNGGDGGIGISFSGADASFVNSGGVYGGDGGVGGAGGYDGGGVAKNGPGGDGGNGGTGIHFAGSGHLTNTGTIQGGNGQVSGISNRTQGQDGLGGIGIEGSDLTITNDGTIAGGMNGDGTQAFAIHFTGGTNELILEANSNITGNVQADGTNDTLTLGGDADGGDLNLNGQYNGFEQLKKTGNSVWNIDGNNAGTPLDLTVEQGEVRMGHPGVSGSPPTGPAYDGNISVHTGATVSGYPEVLQNLDNDGIVAPGGPGVDDYGTFAVDQNYTQTAIGTLRIIVAPGGASRLLVGGMADLGGGKLDLAFAPGVYTQTDYAIVQSGGLNGSTFGTVTQNGGAIYGGVDYDPNNVTLHVLSGSGGSGGGTVTVAPENGQVIGAATNTVVLGAQVSTRALFGHLDDHRLGTTDDTLRTAFADSNPAQAAFAGDMAALNNIVACLPEALARNGGWFRATGGFGSIDGNNGAPGLDSYGGGFMAGYDRQITDNILLGAAAGFSRTQINQDDGSDASVNTPRVTLYGSYQYQHFALDLSLGYGFDRIKMRNQSAGGTAKSAHDAHELVAAMQAGYSIDLPSNVVLTPRIGVDYLHLFEDGYKESGAGAFDLQADSSDTDSLKPHVGVSAAKTFATDNGWNLIPELNLTYSREMLDNSHQAQVLVGGGNFTVDGLKLTRDELALGANLTAQVNQTLELFGGYTAILPIGNTISHNFEAGLRASF